MCIAESGRLVRKYSAGATTSFKDLGVRHDLCEALAAANIVRPNHTQTAAIPAIATGRNVLIGAQTGSGKTLSYLLPMVQNLKRAEERADGARAKPGKPRAVVLVPTRELGEQVMRPAKTLSHNVRFRAMVLSGGAPMAPQKRMLAGSIDLLVATPGRLL